ncbi:SRPBCC family protein [Rhizobium binxianense]
MTAMPQQARSGHVREIVLIRDIDAPRDLVFSLWTKPEHLIHWWGPTHCSAPSVSVDLREGGAWRHCILAPDGKEYWSHGRYVEVAPPERLVFTFAWENEPGKPEHEMQVTIELQEKGEGTRLVFRKRELPDDTEFRLQTEGWAEALEKVAAQAETLARGRT